MPSTALLTALATLLVTSLTCTGLGLLFFRILKPRSLSFGRVCLAFWAGWCVQILILQILQLFSALNTGTGLLLIFLGVIGWALSISQLKESWGAFKALCQAQPREKTRLLVFGFAMLVLTHGIAKLSLNPPEHHDFGNYHLATIRWLENYPIVPGLGNLHLRLGFNQSYFLFPAQLMGITKLDFACLFANGVLFLGLFALQVWHMTAALLGWSTLSPQRKAHCLYHGLILGIVLREIHGLGVSSPATDQAWFILGIVLGGQLLELLFTSEDIDAQWFTIVLLAATLFTVKLSAAIFVTGALLTATLCWFMLPRETPKSRTAVFAVAALIILLLWIPWGIRGAIQTGYIFFPSEVLGYHADWQLPAGTGSTHVQVIRAWAREPHNESYQSLQTWDWLGPWWANTWRRFRFETVVPLGLGFIGWLSVLSSLRTASRATKLGYAGLFLTCLASLGFWFFSAPDVRFAGAVFWIFCALPCSISFATRTTESTAWFKKPCTQAGFLIALVVILALPFKHMQDWAETLLIPELSKTYPVPPQDKPAPFVTDSGMKLEYVTTGKEAWNAGLLVTPVPDKHLKFRDPNDISRGFMIDSSK